MRPKVIKLINDFSITNDFSIINDFWGLRAKDTFHGYTARMLPMATQQGNASTYSYRV